MLSPQCSPTTAKNHPFIRDAELEAICLLDAALDEVASPFDFTRISSQFDHVLASL